MSVKKSMKSVYSLIAGVGLLGMSMGAHAATITLAEQGGTVDAVNMADITVGVGTTILNIWAVDLAGAYGGSFGINYDSAALGIDGLTFNFAVLDGFSGFATFDDGVGTVSSVNIASNDLTNGFSAGNVLLGTLTFIANTAGATVLSLFEEGFDPFILLDGITTVNPTMLGANLTVAAVPLPAAVWLFGSALVGVIGLSRRKQKLVNA